MKETVLLYPGLDVGHLTSMVALADVFLRHGVDVTVALVEPLVQSPDFSAAVARAAHLPRMNPALREFLRSLPSGDALVLDMFCTDALDVAAELKLPVYSFYPSGAGVLPVFLRIPILTASFGEPLLEPDLDVFLLDGFLERTKGKGLVVKSLASQVDVLCHRATDAFVTQCEWNSTLEDITDGLPLLCWSRYLEQRMNKMFIVEEMKLRVEMRRCNEGVVMADEVEANVR
ncbi:hypothetical protein ACP70R_038282 [Stipagrostis hirtigluma subsp. patula]